MADEDRREHVPVGFDPAAAAVGPLAHRLPGDRAAIIGVAAGIVPYIFVMKVKSMFGYDDALDTFGVHAVGGTMGALLTGFLATAPQTHAWDSRVVRVSISATCPPALAALRDNVVMNRPGARRPTLRPKQR